MMNKIKMTSGKARKILYGFYNKDCYYNTPLYEAIPFILKENKDLQQKLDKILTYAKKQCDDYLKEDDCEYCDGVFASCRKILQLAGEDISEYE